MGSEGTQHVLYLSCNFRSHTVDEWMDDIIYPDPSPKRYTGYSNYIYPCMYK